MDRVAIAGLSLHDVELDALERAKRRVVGAEIDVAHALADALGASDVAVISTCNRLEIVYAREEGHRPSADDLDGVCAVLGIEGPDLALREHLQHVRGLAAARHLFRVAASLDSLVVGEDQILAQVRDAYQRAEAARLCGPLLGSLFQAALQVGKEVRTRTPLSRHPVSVVSIAVQRLLEHFEARTPRVGVIGAGAMGDLIARNLSAAGLPPVVFANRSLDRARDLAAQHGAQALGLDDLASGPALDAVVSATSSPVPILDAGTQRALASRAPLGAGLLTVDLAVPRDIASCDDPAVVQIDIEHLRTIADANRARRARAAVDAERLVERKLDVLARRFSSRAVSEALAEIQTETSDILERALADLRNGRLTDLAPEQRRAVEIWARSAFGRLTHVPMAAIKRFAASHQDNHRTQEGQAPSERPQEPPA